MHPAGGCLPQVSVVVLEEVVEEEVVEGTGEAEVVEVVEEEEEEMEADLAVESWAAQFGGPL